VARHHELVVEIECDDAQGSREAQDRLRRWIETFGHTAAGHGFTFLEPLPAAPPPELRLPPNARDVTAVGRYAEKLETMSAPAAGSTKSTTKVDRDAEIAAPAEHVNTKGCIGKDKIRGALQVTMAGFGVGLFQVVKHTAMAHGAEHVERSNLMDAMAGATRHSGLRRTMSAPGERRHPSAGEVGRF
jgi:hypothetical protein